MERWIIFLQFAITLVLSERINLSNYECYQPRQLNYRNGRIVGGFSASKENTVFMAALTRSGGNVFCGSSIISEKFLIVAAHCVCNNQNKIMKPTQMRIYIGINKISDINEISSTSPTEVTVEKIIIHPDYVCGKKSDADIALLHLTKPIIFSADIKPLCIESSDSDLSANGIVNGYGMTHEDFTIGEKPDVLQSASVPLRSYEECQEIYASISKNFLLTDRQLCAGGRDADSCFSDSGGPLIHSEKGSLIGVVSNGIGCGRKGLPGIYVKVSKFTQWIRDHVISP